MGGLSDYFAMGGYAAFIWPAYAVAAVVMIVLLAVSYRAYRTRGKELDLAERERRGRRAVRPDDGPAVDPAGEGEVRT